jgi:hypothetical protein
MLTFIIQRGNDEFTELIRSPEVGIRYYYVTYYGQDLDLSGFKNLKGLALLPALNVKLHYYQLNTLTYQDYPCPGIKTQSIVTYPH